MNLATKNILNCTLNDDVSTNEFPFLLGLVILLLVAMNRKANVFISNFPVRFIININTL
jgi:hypothetical protein